MAGHDLGCECAACADARHAAAHPATVDGCLACKLSTIQVSQQVKGHRLNGPPPAGNRNHWENGIAKDARGVPFLDGAGEPIAVKRYGEQRSRLEAEQRRLIEHPDPFGAIAP